MAATGQGRGIEVKHEYLDPAWKSRWIGAKAKYPEELIDNVGMVRGLFKSPDAPSTEDQVFIVCKTGPHEEGGTTVVEVYSSVPAANEHVLLQFAKEYGDSIGADCSWSNQGQPWAGNLLGASAQMAWSFSPHACLSLEVLHLPGDEKLGTRKIWVDEKWVETEPSEPLVRSALG